MRVSVIGAGRWASVYRGLLSAHELTDFNPEAAIVVNRAAHHESSAAKMLEAGIPTLVEKPFALSVAGVQRLDQLAYAGKVYLAAAHVLKFNEHLDDFAANLSLSANKPHYASITWTDPKEGGHYDPTLPLVTDIMPHVASIIDTLFPGPPPVLEGWSNFGGDFRFMVGHLCVDVHMERDADERKRVVEVACGRTVHRLDFTSNPTDHNPLSRLIEKFLEGAAGGHKDHRLDTRLAFMAAGLTERCLEKCG
jgi:hypothetical protein